MDGGNKPPAQFQFEQRKRQQAEVAGVSTNDDTLEDWLRRLETKIDLLLRDIVPRVAVLESTVGQLQAAPARFRSWSNWVVNLATALVGGCGCMVTLGALATVVAAVVSVAKFAMHP